MKGGIVAVAVVLLLTGCTAQPHTLTDSDYLRLVRHDVPELAQRSDSEVFKAGQAACALLADRDGWYQAVATLTQQSSFTGAHAGRFLGYAMGRYCPQFESTVPKV